MRSITCPIYILLFISKYHVSESSSTIGKNYCKLKHYSFIVTQTWLLETTFD